MRLSARVHGRSHRFGGIREVLARANEPKSGDRLAGIAARSHLERVAAKRVLAELTLAELRAHPVVPLEDDEVSRVIDGGVDEAVHHEIRGWSVAELRDWLLADTTASEAIRRVSRGLTAEMAAAVGKLCSNLDLVYGARKMPVTTRARTTVGLPGRLSTRLQPNHPADDPRGITAAIYEGLAYGAGDALIGINPCVDEVANVTALLRLTADLIARWRIPTQNCVLAHVTTQMRALAAGAPMDILFQSLAGTAAANRSFGIDVAMLDEARAMIGEKVDVRAGARARAGASDGEARRCRREQCRECAGVVRTAHDWRRNHPGSPARAVSRPSAMRPRSTIQVSNSGAGRSPSSCRSVAPSW